MGLVVALMPFQVLLLERLAAMNSVLAADDHQHGAEDAHNQYQYVEAYVEVVARAFHGVT